MCDKQGNVAVTERLSKEERVKLQKINNQVFEISAEEPTASEITDVQEETKAAISQEMAHSTQQDQDSVVSKTTNTPVIESEKINDKPTLETRVSNLEGTIQEVNNKMDLLLRALNINVNQSTDQK